MIYSGGKILPDSVVKLEEVTLEGLPIYSLYLEKDIPNLETEIFMKYRLLKVVGENNINGAYLLFMKEEDAYTYEKRVVCGIHCD